MVITTYRTTWFRPSSCAPSPTGYNLALERGNDERKGSLQRTLWTPWFTDENENIYDTFSYQQKKISGLWFLGPVRLWLKNFQQTLLWKNGTTKRALEINFFRTSCVPDYFCHQIPIDFFPSNLVKIFHRDYNPAAKSDPDQSNPDWKISP